MANWAHLRACIIQRARDSHESKRETTKLGCRHSDKTKPKKPVTQKNHTHVRTGNGLSRMATDLLSYLTSASCTEISCDPTRNRLSPSLHWCLSCLCLSPFLSFLAFLSFSLVPFTWPMSIGVDVSGVVCCPRSSYIVPMSAPTSKPSTICPTMNC